jgi:hypothetical protein
MQVHTIPGPSHYNGFVKFEYNDRYHCIRITILNGDDLLDTYIEKILLLHIYV